MICFYHSADLDGHCSGAIVKKFNPDCKMQGFNYGEEFPWEDVKNQDVIMVDICLQPFSEHMPRLSKIAKSLIWIDHHQTEIEDFLSYNTGIGDFGSFTPFLATHFDKSACELTWEFYQPGIVSPIAIYLLGRYDIWDLDAHPDVMSFQWGMRLFKDTYPESAIWENLLNPNKPTIIDTIIDRGELILEFRDSENAKYISGFAFETKFEELRCICINRGMTNSQIFDSIWNPNKYDAMLTFVWKKGQWTVSLYGTKNIDLSVIAKKHGGGGHKQACGFQCKELPFKLK